VSFIERVWFEPPSLLTRCVYFGLLPLSRLFAAISHRRKMQYADGKKAVYRASVPVIVVGNITAGGNGKTPMVIWLVEQLQSQGLRVGVVSRGYGGKAPHYPYLVNEDTPALWVGDEPVLIRLRTQCAVAVAPIRSEAVQLLEPDVDVIVTDDGLQHYALSRDIEFSVVDGVRRYGNGACLPAGPLREPCSRLSSVDFQINNGGVPHEHEMAMRLKPIGWINVKTGEHCDALPTSPSVAMAGIGHPPRFFETLNVLGLSVSATHAFADHQTYQLDTLQGLTPNGERLLMTEKDAVKCQAFAKDNWWYLRVSAVLSNEDRLAILQRILNVRKNYGSSAD
jgi:tetraacyldisaccharide 4'-kinase